jgi:lipopolysaccharide/colanic/teichoic acid biosynthesis glycosyltransferase
MRLVGPRPELEYFVAQYPEEYLEILNVAPGITGNAQLRFLGERHLLSGPDPASIYSAHVLPVKIKIDLAYAASHSLRVDFGILVRTAVVPLAYLVGHFRTPGSTVRRWVPASVASALLALLFILVSGQLP